MFKSSLLVVSLFLLFLVPVHFSSGVRSANLTNVKILLSTPRLSFSGLLDGTNTAGTSLVNLQTTQYAAASTSSANLFEGDTILIGDSQYRVASPSATGSFTITGLPSTPGMSVLQASDDDLGDVAIASRSTLVTANFTTVTAIPNGQFRILIPAASVNNNDALPDQTGWDFGGGANSSVSVTCPDDLNTGGDNYDFVAGVATASALVRDGRTYHAFTCAYAGTGGSGTTFDTANKQFIINDLINPAPAANHSEGYADTYRIVVEQMTTSGSDLVVDSTQAAVAVIESVRVTATVAPQITFRILGVAAGANVCSTPTSVATTPILVPLGELIIDSFKYAAQQLIVSTNADNGYSVTAIEDDQLRRLGVTCTGDASTGSCIPDSKGDNALMSHTTPDKWTALTAKGFAYSLQNNTAPSIAFEHNTTGGSCDGTPGGCFKQFADQEDAVAQAPQELFSSTTVADNENAYICYKAIIASTQEAGTDYATAVTYRATASF